jgi:hypothetical protein
MRGMTLMMKEETIMLSYCTSARLTLLTKESKALTDYASYGLMMKEETMMISCQCNFNGFCVRVG